MSDRARIILAVLLLASAPFISYGLALAGEPQSAWLWCDVLRVC